MKVIACILFLLVAALPAHGEELLRDLHFDAANAEGVVEITADPDNEAQLLFNLPEPGVTGPIYALKGMVRYDAVVGTAYLQLDNYFNGHGVFFSKTLADSGPLERITGSSGWREFVLPFFANSDREQGAENITPDRLTLLMHLPDGGSVYLRDVALYQYANGENPLTDGAQWFGDRTGTRTGAIGGGLIGLWGALIGILAARGRAKGFVLVSAGALFVIGLLSAVAGVIALAMRQPYAVYYPLLLVGFILTIVVGALWRTLPQRYQAAELKKMRAMDS